ncbi:MAG: hypothetical protein ACOCRK_07110 [bacterium]
MSKIHIPVTTRMQGIITAITTNVETGEKNTRIVQNMILDENIDSFLNKGAGLTGASDEDSTPVIGKCLLGDSDVAPSPEQTDIQGTVLAETTEGTIIKDNEIDNGYFNNAKKFIFPAGVGTGTVREVMLKTTHGKTRWDNSLYSIDKGEKAVARKVFSPPIEKNENIQLEIVWELRLNIGDQIWSGTISNGQIDGTSISWTASINNAQVPHLFTSYFRYKKFTPLYSATGIANYFNSNESLNHHTAFRVKLGDSNASSDLINDGPMDIKGDLLETITPTLTRIPYDDTIKERSFEIMLNTDQGNGQIGEMVLCSIKDSTYTVPSLGFMRFTFDPPLNKVDTHRLYLEIKLEITT